jgi:hypothetical protein
MTIYALVDCNNFYASCERVFNPKLEGRPVVILSSNDENAVGSSAPPYGGAQIEGGVSIKDAILGSCDAAKVSIPKAAAALNVGTASVERAKRVLKSGDQDLIDAPLSRVRWQWVRRHLTASQRAMVAAKMANLKAGENVAGSSGPPYGGAQIEGGVSIPDAAKTLNVGERSVTRAKQVLKSGDQDLIDADMTSTAVVQHWYRTSTDMGLLPDVLDIRRPIFKDFPY